MGTDKNIKLHIVTDIKYTVQHLIMAQVKKVCCVVGLGGNGIGDYVARKFAAEGYHVAIMSRTLENLQKISNEIGPDICKPYACDASIKDQVHATVAQILKDFEVDAIDVLIYNALAYINRSFSEMTEEVY